MARDFLVESLKGIVEQPDPGARHAKPCQRQLLLKPPAQLCRTRTASRRQAREEIVKLAGATPPAAPRLCAKCADTEMLVDRHLSPEPAPVGDQAHPPLSPDLRR